MGINQFYQWSPCVRTNTLSFFFLSTQNLQAGFRCIWRIVRILLEYSERKKWQPIANISTNGKLEKIEYSSLTKHSLNYPPDIRKLELWRLHCEMKNKNNNSTFLHATTETPSIKGVVSWRNTVCDVQKRREAFLFRSFSIYLFIYSVFFLISIYF